MAGTISSDKTASPSTGHIRGSWLLVVGRLANVAIDFAIQVLLVRYLSTSDYGAFAYALSIVSLAATVAVLGLDRAVGRYIPIYDERDQRSQLLGAWLLVSTSVLVLGVAIAALVIGVGSLIGDRVVSDPEALMLLMILVVMTPLNALAAITRQVLATFASPRLILFRSYLLSPMLQLGLVLVVVLSGSSIQALAVGWVATIVASAAVSTVLVVRILRSRGVLRRARLRTMEFPARALFSFGVPLFASTLVVQLRLTGAVILLEYLYDTTAVALFRAAVPIARQTQLLFETFQLLFTPLAARLYARGERAQLNDAYWQTTLWIAVFSFPLFVLAFAFPEPLIGLVFGDRYRPMAAALALLSLGFYVNAALGFNALLLRILGRVRYTVTVDVASTLIGLVAAFPLVINYGVTGAAAAVTATLVVQNIAYQLGLSSEPGLRPLDLRYAHVYLSLAFAAAGLRLVGSVLPVPLIVALALSALASLGVLLVSRRSLQIGRVFPELRRLPFARWLIPG